MKTLVISIFTYFFILLNKTVSIMGSCNSGDHIAEDHVHMNITTCNTEEPQQKYRLGTVGYRLLWGGWGGGGAGET